MSTLKELLDELDIKVETDDKDDPFKDFDVEKVAEEHRPAIKALMAGEESLKNELAQSKLVIQTLQSTQEKPKEEKVEKKDEKDEFGLEKDDPYSPVFKKMFGAIDELKTDKAVDAKEQFATNLKTFAEKKPDIARFANDMDAIAAEHPTLYNDIPKLYTLAKRMAEGRKVKQKGTETPGASTDNVVSIQQACSIKDAFELAEKKMGGK